MKITIYTFGTRGDVMPYVALGGEAIKRGHEVTICTGGYFKKDVERYGINFVETSLDLMAELQTEIGKIAYNEPMKNITKVIKYAKDVINPKFRKSFTEMFKSAENADVILYHPKAFAAQDIALYYNIPCVSVPLVPLTVEIEEFPNMLISLNRNFGKKLNKLTYKITSKTENNNIKDINDFRVKELGFQPRKANVFNTTINSYKIPVIMPIGEDLFKDIKSLKERAYITNHFIINSKENLSDGLLEFINNGSKPIVISFSSLPLADKEKFQSMISYTVSESKERVVVLSGENNLVFNDDNIYVEKFTPHQKLLPLAKGFIHHGGAGSTGIALGCGVPQLIIPFKVDQPFWAKVTYQNGFSLKPVQEKNLSKEILLNAFKDFNNMNNQEKDPLVWSGSNKAIDIIEDIVLKFKGYKYKLFK